MDELGEAPTIAAAVDLFFGDLRLAPRTKKTYWHGIAISSSPLARGNRSRDGAGLGAAAGPRHIVRGDPGASGYPHSEEVSQMRTAQNNISAVKFCSYLSSYDLNTDLAGPHQDRGDDAASPRRHPMSSFQTWKRSSLSSTDCRERRNRSSSCAG